MEELEFKAFVVTEEEGTFIQNIKRRCIADLPEGDTLMKVYYSSLNYKDALSASGNRGVTRKYPHTPGIDAVGEVVSCKSGKFNAGDKLIVTSYDLGMNTAGGFGQYIRVPSEWVVPLPEGLSMKEAMMFGTAGLTAAIMVSQLVESIAPKDGSIIVSGATGGVGSLSIAILKLLGYSVVAITGKASEHSYLKNLGASEVIERKEFERTDHRLLLGATYAGAIDTLGGIYLEKIIKMTQEMGVVCCCGNAASPNINLSVYPFILRGVSLVGISTQNYPMNRRKKVWDLLSNAWKPEDLATCTQEVLLKELSEQINLMLKGKHRGRTIVNLIDS